MNQKMACFSEQIKKKTKNVFKKAMKSIAIGAIATMLVGHTVPAFATMGTSAPIGREEVKNVVVLYHNEQGRQAIVHKSVEISHQFESISAVSAYVTDSGMAELKNNPNIASIEENITFKVDGQLVGSPFQSMSMARIPQEQSRWHYQAIVPNGHALLDGITGQGVKVAVIDSGIAEHPDLNIAGRVSLLVDNPDTPEDESSPDDHNGHGTHIAGIIAAKHNGVGIVGIAPDVELYGVKVFGADGLGYVSNVILGIEWAIQNNMDIINLSIGSIEHSEAFKRILDRAYQQGILIVASAGNNGQSVVQFPAAYDSTIAVSAITRNRTLANFSDYGAEIEFTAPGVGIRSTYLDQMYADMDGTSQAAPHITGLLALLKQKNKSLTANELRAELVRYTEDIEPIGRDIYFGHGLPFYQRLGSGQQATTVTDPDQQNESEENVATSPDPNPARTPEDTKVTIPAPVDEPVVVENPDRAAHLPTLNSDLVNIETVKTIVARAQNQPAIEFRDVSKNHWGSVGIRFASQMGIVSGSGDGSFKPNHNVTRAEFAKMLVSALSLQSTGTTTFKDVENHWAAEHIQVLKELGIVGGYRDGTFRPNQEITRAEMVAILSKVVHTHASITDVTFNDIQGHWAAKAIASLAGAGIVQGKADAKFDPNANATRAESVVMILRLLNVTLDLKLEI